MRTDVGVDLGAMVDKGRGLMATDQPEVPLDDALVGGSVSTEWWRVFSVRYPEDKSRVCWRGSLR